MFLKVTLKTGVEHFVNTRHILWIQPGSKHDETILRVASSAIEERWRNVEVAHNISEVERRLANLGEA